MNKQESFLRWVLLLNGIVDLICVLILLGLPPTHRALLGYQVFDSQGAFMAGGWGIATLALGVTRIWTSGRSNTHDAMKLMGITEASMLTVFTVVYLAIGRATFEQALLPLAVGVVFGVLYLVAVVWKQKT
jgi:hypothetical protein